MNIFRSNTVSVESLLKKAGCKNLTKETVQSFLKEKGEDILVLWEEFNGTADEITIYSNPQAIIEEQTSEKLNSSSYIEEDVIEENIAIKNGMINKEYKTNIDFPDSKVSHLKVKSKQKYDQLNYDFETSELSAIPLETGDSEIWIEYTTRKRLKLNLFINEDPVNLWKDIPSTEDFKPDNTCSLIENKDFKVISASHRGRSHANKALYRDDHVLTDFFKDWAIAIVADGAGSAILSSLGSKVACETAMNQIKHHLSLNEDELVQSIGSLSIQNEEHATKTKKLLYQVLVDAAHKSLKAMHEEAKNIERPLKELSTTLSISIIKKFEFGKFVATFQVGDGAIATYNSEEVDLLCKIDSGEYKGQTLFLNSKPVFNSSDALMERIFFKLYNKDNVLLLMTDGIVDPFFEGDEKLLRYHKEWKKLWESISASLSSEDAPDEKLLEWMNFYVEGEHDDRTLAIIIDK